MSIRLPRALERELQRRARDRAVPASQLVREAVALYLAPPARAGSGAAVVERFAGSVTADRAAAEWDELARRIQAHSFRE